MTPVTDPALIQQLDSAPPPADIPPGMTAADPATAAALDAMATKSQPITWQDRIASIFGNHAAQQKVIGADVAGLRNSSVGGFIRGLRDPIDQGAAMLSKLIGSPQQQQATAAANTAAEQDYAQNWRQGQLPGFDVGRLAGNIAMTAPLGYAMPGATAARLLPRMASGAASGAVSGALQPTDPNAPDFWSQVARNVGIGAAGGAVAPALIGGISRVISPNVSPDVQTLMNAGVRPTPGQILGGTPNRIEQGLTSVPGPGDFIKNARRDAVMQFNAGAINQALAPIGEKLESPVGSREAIDEMQTKIGNAYDRLVPSLGINAGGPAAVQLNGDLGNILRMSRFMPPDRANQLRSFIQANIFDKMSPYGGMTGQSFQEGKSELGRLAATYMNSSSADERQLGGALMQAQVAMRNALRIGNPATAAQLGATDNAFAQSLRINNAATRTAGAEPGLFSPAQLQAATKAMDPSLRKHAFAAGDALMQNYAEAGKSVLGNTVPDSGTPYRHALEGAIGLLAGHAVPGISEYSGPAAVGYAGLTGLTGLAYSPPVRAAIAHAMTSRPAIAAPAAQALRLLGPGVAPAFGALAPGF